MAVSVSFTYPVAGATPPTTTQMAQYGTANAVFAQITYGLDSDTVALVTHNFGFAAAQLNQLFPDVHWSIQNQGGAGTANPVLSYTSAANLVVLTKTNTANTSCTVNMWIYRPNTLMI